MNTLSWLIYLGGASSSLGFLSVLFAFVLFSFIIIYVLIFFANQEDKIVLESIKIFPVKTMFILALLASISSCLLPSKETVYMIAASEIGQKVIESKNINGIVDSSLELVKQRINEELTKKPDSK